ncbi:hypothetical protein [Glutamicibacter sp. X7]
MTSHQRRRGATRAQVYATLVSLARNRETAEGRLALAQMIRRARLHRWSWPALAVALRVTEETARAWAEVGKR